MAREIQMRGDMAQRGDTFAKKSLQKKVGEIKKGLKYKKKNLKKKSKKVNEHKISKCVKFFFEWRIYFPF